MSDITSRFVPHSDGTFTIHRRQDAEPTIENNKALQSVPQRTDGLKHIASIPAVVFERWMKETGAPLLSMPAHEFQQFIRKKLRDPEWLWLRTTGRL
jgi:hypothetical protein